MCCDSTHFGVSAANPL
ncbi:hypothetical protein E2C01_102329 [Portunus trituberculatus]|uniref:Uncharacterized protein n=1 Tax=Portunus trituberculatus TaxID=210409 RepID=A0A5B7KNY2_PORTR|nr:hypothetical protein [Portunus trituberculatus]